MVVLRSEQLELRFEPEQGGKWRSLYDRRTGREWLWSNPHLRAGPFSYGDSFIEKLDTGGWDEIFPSVDPCGSIPDHGDLVQLPWQVDEQSETRLNMAVQGRCFPFLFERTVTLSGSVIHCGYRLENCGETPFPWLWCAHPLLPFSSELDIEVSGSCEVLLAMGAAEELEGKRIQWSELPNPGTPWAAKLFSERGAVNEVTARHSDGSGLRLEWDAADIPYLGLWANNGAWSGCGSEPYFNIGIEPAMLPVDDLSEVDNPPELEPGQVVEWALNISLV